MVDFCLKALVLGFIAYWRCIIFDLRARWNLLLKIWRRDTRLAIRAATGVVLVVIKRFLGCNVVTEFKRIATSSKFKNRTMLINSTTGVEWTFDQVEKRSNQIANYFYMKQGFRKGDCIGIYMKNSPEYVITWLGLAKIGVNPALLNYDLKGQSLLHCISVGKCKGLIYSADLETAVNDIKAGLVDEKKLKNIPNFSFFHYPATTKTTSSGENLITNDHHSSFDLNGDLDEFSTQIELCISKSVKISANDVLFYIYTSGTTGLPKAVPIKHVRQFLVAHAFYYGLDINADSDIMYSYLPLYHSSGSQIGVSLAMLFGLKTVIGAKFSASNFFIQCAKWNITITQYIGEVCRFLMATKENLTIDKGHSVRIMTGNGLTDVHLFNKMKNRFGIDRIVEFYGSTEGSTFMVNMENKAGSCGFITSGTDCKLWPHFFTDKFMPLYLVKVDLESGAIVKNENSNFCIQCEADEVGELIGKIVKNHPTQDFIGYKDDGDKDGIYKSQTEQKIIRNVFKYGDVYFRTGDLFKRDSEGWMYFVDRCGDTFRWLGENTSTSEVENVLSKCLPSHATVNCFGVQVPGYGTESRGGMVAISLGRDQNYENWSKDSKFCQDSIVSDISKCVSVDLPSHARPLFIKFVENMELTGTHKLKKRSLMEQSFHQYSNSNHYVLMSSLSSSITSPHNGHGPNPHLIKQKEYVKLTKDIYDKLNNGTIKL